MNNNYSLNPEKIIQVTLIESSKYDRCIWEDNKNLNFIQRLFKSRKGSGWLYQGFFSDSDFLRNDEEILEFIGKDMFFIKEIGEIKEIWEKPKVHILSVGNVVNVTHFSEYEDALNFFEEFSTRNSYLRIKKSLE